MSSSAVDFSKTFWGPVTASHNFCEEDYKHTPYIAETFNTLSNIVYLIFAFYGFYRTRSFLRMQLVYINLFVIGIGSFLFHASMLREYQLLDELPMLYATLISVFCITFHKEPEVKKEEKTTANKKKDGKNKEMSTAEEDEDQDGAKNEHGNSSVTTTTDASADSSKKWMVGSLLFAVAVVETYLMVAHPTQYWIFLTMFIGLFVSNYFRIMHMCFWMPSWAQSRCAVNCKTASKNRKTLCAYSVAFILIAAAVWIIDHAVCDQVQHLHLHSFWHLFSGLAIYYKILLATYAYYTDNGYKVKLIQSGSLLNYILPYCYLQKED